MQIDFHHGVTYVCARLAGFTKEQADIIAYAAQYIDDATNEGVVLFENDAIYWRTATAHKMLDYENTVELMNRDVWLPFHFLPGNGGLPASQEPDGHFADKLICRPDSFIAHEAISACFADRHKPYGLHRLGVMAHVYADTWAHQGFAGIIHIVNKVDDLEGVDEAYAAKVKANLSGMYEKTKRTIAAGAEYFHSFFDNFTSSAVEAFLPLGHGAALSCPDRPYLIWRYKNGRGEVVERDNPKDFSAAADALYRMFSQYKSGKEWHLSADTLPDQDRKIIDRLLRETVNEDGDIRHTAWIAAIENGAFSFGGERVAYVPKGIGSWKYAAIEDDQDIQPDRKFPFKPAFMNSHWKMFHDAVKAHRFSVIVDILPRYGICAR